jgi:carbon-monoxide dehydrogenase medium subunit
MNFRLAQIPILVDLNRVPELSYVRPVDGGLAVGAMARARDVECSELTADRVPLLPKALRYVGHPQIRNRGTLGGSIAHADPAAEVPTVATALGAQMVVRSLSDQRVLQPHEFFVTHLTTSMAANELLTEIRFPRLPPRTGTAFLEYARRHGDFAIVGVATTVTLDGYDRCRTVRIALAGVADQPVDASATARSLVGAPMTEAGALEVGQQISASLEPTGDIHATAAYRRRLAGLLVRDALVAAEANARSSGG